MISFSVVTPDYPPFKTPFVTAEVHEGGTRFRCNFRFPTEFPDAAFKVRWFRSDDDALIKEDSEFLIKSEIKYFGNDVRFYEFVSLMSCRNYGFLFYFHKDLHFLSCCSYIS